TARFNVKQPTVTNLDILHRLVGIQLVSDQPRLRYGDPLVAPGVEFQAEVDNNGIDGSYQWVQIYSETKSVHLLVNATDPVCGAGGTLIRTGEGLDKTYPYHAGTYMADSPDIELLIGDDLVSVSDSASAWLMFKPNLPNAIWIPLKKLEWSWGGSVRRIPRDH